LKALEPVLSTDDGPEYTTIYNELMQWFRLAKRQGELV
jgi:hypothetical protein